MNIGLIGLGNMGKNHFRVAQTIAQCNVSAVCDSNKSAIKHIPRGAKTRFYEDFQKMLTNEQLDAVIIASPTTTHFKIARETLRKRIPTLVEKPLTSTSREGKILVDYAREKKILFTVGHIERHNPAVKKLFQLSKRKTFGDVLTVSVKRVGIYTNQSRDANVVTDLAVHDLDIIHKLFSRMPNTVYAKGSRIFSNVEDCADILLTYNNSACSIQTNWITPTKVRTFSITTTTGYLELNYITQEIVYFSRVSSKKTTATFKQSVKQYGSPKRKKIEVKVEEPLKNQLHNFVRAVEGKEKVLVSAQDGLDAIKLTEYVNKSIKLNELIHIK